MVGDDFCNMVADFHQIWLVRGGSTSFLVLIPKENPVGIDDYRPIFLIGCM